MLAAGAFYDVREHRIPNWWVAASAAAGVMLAVLESGEPISAVLAGSACLRFLFRMLVVGVLCFPLFLCRMTGAGDVKLAALVCGYLGVRSGGAALFLGLLAGAVWSFGKMAAGHSFCYRFSYLRAYFRRIIHTGQITAYYSPLLDGYESTIPLGVCLFLGTGLWMLLGQLG